jgi:two-component system, NtrC family, response regulator AtoC
MNPLILIVDDDESMCEMLEDGLATKGYELRSATSAGLALDILSAHDVDVVLTDIRMPGMSGLNLCERIAELRPDIPVVVMTAFGNMDVAIAAIRSGAYDFAVKPINLEALRIIMRRAMHHRSLSKKIERLERAIREAREVEGMLGASQAMQRVFDLIERVSPSEASVLITGASGTGKELVARAIHQRGPRSAGPFVAVNCAAMPEALLESELFGAVKGAYTGAFADRRGLFAQANQGTLFLDEIGEMPLGLQPKLLRALEERSVRPIGGQREVPFDTRIIAATNRDLEEAVEERRFRDDLFYRLQVIVIDVPPLSTRGGDVLLLAQSFCEHFATLTERAVEGINREAANRLLAYPWPGNVRELRNCIERAVTLCRFSEITVEDLPENIRNYCESSDFRTPSDPTELVSMDEVERRYVLRVYEATAGNKSLAAKILGFNRKTLYSKLRRYGVIPLPDLDNDD